MSAELTLDFDRLMAPITEEAPTGQSLREHPELSRQFYEVREARNAAMEAERVLARQALMDESDFAMDPAGQEDVKPPDWRKVVDRATDLLCNFTKDLWIVSWLTEGQTRLAGIAGFRDSLRFCRELSEKYWDTIFPRPDEEDGYGLTVAQLAGLDNSMSSALEGASMLPGEDRLTWTSYRLALELEKADPERRASRIEAGAMTESDFESRFRAIDREQLKQARETLVEAREECDRFGDVMDALCGKDEAGYQLGPPTGNMTQTLDRMLRDFDTLASGLLEEAVDAAEEVEAEATTLTARNAEGLSQRPVASRDEALQHLLRVADFFRKTEPHSPVSYALEQAVRWGRMPLPDLLKDLVSDQTVLAEVFKRMGIPPASEGESESGY